MEVSRDWLVVFILLLDGSEAGAAAGLKVSTSWVNIGDLVDLNGELVTATFLYTAEK